MSLTRFTLIINGAERMVLADAEKDTLALVLRRMGLTGTKVGCGIGVCGACSVILNGKVIRSCTRKMKTVEPNSEITTIEGIGAPGRLHPLQQAWITYGGVQCGFCSPGFIVSAKALLDENPNPTRQEVRAWFQKHRNVCRCTGYKPLVDAVMAAAKVLRGEATMEDITYQYPENKEFYGTAVPRPAALAKVCGLCDYGDDIKFKMPPNTLHLAVVQPRIAHHANILNIDFSEAEKMPGVVKVLTAKDVKGTNVVTSALANKRAKFIAPNRPILADKKIYRYGDVVAIVAAETEEQARAAAAKVNVEIEQLPEYLNYLDAVTPDAMRIHEEVPNIYMLQPVLKGGRDARDVIEESAYSVEGSFYSSREPHLSIESDIIQAYYDEDGFLTVQCKAQDILGARYMLAAGLGVDVNKFRVIENPTGASFGYATTPGSFALAAVAAIDLQCPVTLTLSYEEHQHYSGKRTPSYANTRFACDEDGKLTAIEYDIGCDHGAYNEWSDSLMDRYSRFIGWPYNVPVVTGLGRMSYTNHSFGTAYRGYGAPQALTSSEAMMDMLAEKIGMDPFEFRYKNIARPGDTNINSFPYKQYPMEEIMDKARPIYEEYKAEAEKLSTPEKKRGVGIAWGGFSCSGGSTDWAMVSLEINPDGTFTQRNTWEDQGQGGDAGTVIHTCKALQPLGVTPDMVKVVMNDSKYCPPTGVAGGSRCHYMAGNATIIAANQLMDAMRKEDGTYRTYQEMVAEGIETRYVARFSIAGQGLHELSPNDGVGDPSPTYMYGIYVCEVEVEVATGKTKVLRMTCVDDVGVIGNPISVEGQAFGGMSHSIGFALSEDYEDVKKHSNMFACGIPYIEDIPDDLNVIHCENPRPDGPFGSAGCSEMYQSGGHVAVLNAIKNAVGVRIHEIPATPDKVKAGIDAIARGEQPYQPKKYFLGSDMYDELDDIKANPV